MRAPFFQSLFYGVTAFVSVTAAFCTALVVAITGPPTATEMTNLGEASGNALEDFGDFARRSGAQFCTEGPVALRDMLPCGRAETPVAEIIADKPEPAPMRRVAEPAVEIQEVVRAAPIVVEPALAGAPDAAPTRRAAEQPRRTERTQTAAASERTHPARRAARNQRARQAAATETRPSRQAAARSTRNRTASATHPARRATQAARTRQAAARTQRPQTRRAAAARAPARQAPAVLRPSTQHAATLDAQGQRDLEQLSRIAEPEISADVEEEEVAPIDDHADERADAPVDDGRPPWPDWPWKKET